MNLKYFALIFLSIFFLNFPLTAEKTMESESVDSIHPFTAVLDNTIESFTGWNLIFHSAAVGSTFGIVHSDLDYRVNKFFYNHNELNPYTTPAVYIGYFAPFATVGGLYLFGKTNESSRAVTASYAVMQASLISATHNVVLKVVTGRPYPDFYRFDDMKAASRKFRFGFMRGGVHYGWPSGHLETLTAIISTLIHFYHDNIFLKIVGGISIGYMAAQLYNLDISYPPPELKPFQLKELNNSRKCIQNKGLTLILKIESKYSKIHTKKNSFVF